jgi:hypothetical protein
MLVRIDDFDDDRMPHKLVFTDLQRLLQAQTIPHITAWQTVSDDDLPAMRVRVGNAPPHGTTREVPDELIHLELQPNQNHRGLNSVLVFRGLGNALADLNVTAAEKREDGRGSELATRVNAQVAPA